MKKKIVIFGGGVSGLTVAHECIEAGFEVHLYERRSFFGGKALGFRDDRGFPVEHASRAYLSGYYCFFETLKRVPTGNGKTAATNFTPLDGVIFSYNGKNTLIPLRYDNTIFARLKALLKNQRDWGLSWWEILQILWLPIGYLLKSEERKKNTIWKKSFAEFHDFKNKSPQYQNYLDTLFNQFIAARCHTISAILDDLMYKFFDFSHNLYKMESLLAVTNGPTNEALIDPWVKHLAQMGVHFHLSTAIEKLVIKDRRVESAILQGGESVAADAFVLALPYPETQSLTPELGLPKRVNLEWSMGFQVYLNDIPSFIPEGRQFVNVQDSCWKILYLLESPALWPKMEYPPNIKAVLSGVIANSYKPGKIFGKPVFECRAEEVKKEILTQLKLEHHPSVSGFRIDPTVQFLPASEVASTPKYKNWDKGPVFSDGYQWIFESSIFIEKPNDFKNPVTQKTTIDRLFLAGEYLKTSFHLPTMERACESGKRCADQIFQAFGLKYPQDRYSRPELPLGWVRKIDAFFYKMFHR